MMKHHLILLTASALAVASTLSAEWHYGVGSGIARLDVEGDIGLTTKGGTPLDLPVDLDPDDVSDLMKTAAGLSGYATNGEWTFIGSFSYLDLEGGGSRGPASADIEFEMLSFEALASYTFYKENGITLAGHGGLRYTSHDLDSDITILAATSTRSIDESWVDAIVGLTVDWQFAEEWAWRNRIDAGFGGSEGMFFAQTGLDWMFREHWSTGIFANIRKVDFEERDTGDLDYYSYDVDEVSFGISLAYHW
jgi:hypothetical protein